MCSVSRIRLFLSQTILLACFFGSPSSARLPVQHKDDAVSVSEFAARAASGDAYGQFKLAVYLYQDGYPPDYPSILVWVESATHQHYPPAQSMLG